MKFVVQNTVSGEYYMGPGYHWTNNLDEATKFASQQSASNVLNITFVKKIQENDIKTAIIMYDEQKNKFQTAQMDFDYDSAKEKTDIVKDAVKNLDNLSALKKYWESEQTKYDRMTQDILHKIELESVMGIEAVRLMKKLKEIRQKRREAKDNVTMLSMLFSCQIGAAPGKLNKFLNGLENRQYTPRELPELFD